MIKAIEKTIKLCGGQSATARACGVKQPAVRRWLEGSKMDVKYIPKIMLATNFQVTPEELRPDVDWAVIKAGK